jgi:large subunit ribosomal protein L4
MVQVPVYRFDTNEVGSAEVDETVFGESVRWRLLRDSVVMYQANRRVGTHSTKTRSEVKGANRKPWRQKGTGRARAGTRRSPIWRGGGITFGPKPRDYSYNMPRKALQQALRSAVLGKLLDGEVAFLDGADFPEPKTKRFVEAFDRLDIRGSALVVLPEGEENVWKSARNLERTRVRTAETVNAYDVVRHERLIFLKSGFDRLLERVGRGEDALLPAEKVDHGQD